jgi:hypothetical protein
MEASEGIFVIPKRNKVNASAPSAKNITEIRFRLLTLNPKISRACQIDPQSAARSEFNLKNRSQPVGVLIIKGRFINNHVPVVISK